MATLGNLLNPTKTAELKTPYANTFAGILENTVKGIPQALADVVGKPSLRAYAALGGAITGKTLTPSTPFQKELYGTDKPITLRSYGAELGIPEQSVFAPVVGFALSIGDLIPSGQTKTISTIAKATKEKDVLRAVKSIYPKLDEKSLVQAAKDLVNVKTEQGVKAYLGTLIKKTTQGITPTELKTVTTQGKIKPLQTVSAEGQAISEGISPTAISKGKLQTSIGKPLQSSVAQSQDFINLERLATSEGGGARLLSTIKQIAPELEQVRGKPLTASEVLKAAQESSLLRKATSREATLKSEAALLATRQNLAAMSEGKGVTKDFIEQLRIVSAEATRRGRELQALGITADPITNTTKGELVKKLIDAGIESDKIVKAAENVDFNDLQQVTNFYRTFIKPTKMEWLDEYRYINLLSSPRTHIVNAFSNLIQGTVLNPATRLATGAVDAVYSALSGKQRQAYAREVLPYTKGFINAIPKAVSSFTDALRGKIFIERPDIARIATNSKLLKPFQGVPRMLEASDVLFRTLIEEGEKQALAFRYAKQGKEITPGLLSTIEKQAKDKAAYFVFRSPLDASNKSGQGKFLSAIDSLTSSVYQLRKVPGVKWFIPFVQTPMNILKQGIEYSPLGLATLPGAVNKTEQVAKSLVGSTVLLGAASLGLQGRLTWAAPTSTKEKNAFYNSGRQPYSVKIGDKWVAYSKIGPLAYPLSMAAALQWYLNENPKADTQSSSERMMNAVGGIAQFLTDQSYLQGIQSLLDFTGGSLPGVQSTFSSTVGQLVPLSSLQRWVSHVIDPVYRKPDTELNVTNLIQSIQKDIPFASFGVPKIKGASERQLPFVNAISPIGITQSVKKGDRELLNIRRQQKNDARLKAIKERTSGSGKSLGSILK